MNESSILLLRQLASLGTREEREDFAFRNPSLLSPAVQESLAAAPAGEAAPIEDGLEFLKRLREELEGGRRPYVIGPGPVENLWLRLERGEISQEYAEELAGRPDFAASLSPVYAQAITRLSHRAARGGNWRPAVQQQRLLIEGLRSRPDSTEALEALREVYLDWLEIVSAALQDIPDARLYYRALADGERLIAAAGQERALLGDAYHRLGVLHLDPYTAGRSSQNYDIQIQIWQQRYVDSVGKMLAAIPQEVRWMPEPPDAMRKAEGYFREAVKYREGYPKGASLKALVDTLAWRGRLGQPANPEETVGLCREALASIEPGLRPDHELTLMAVLEQHDQPFDRERVRTILNTPPPEHLRKLTPGDVKVLIIQGVSLLRDEEPGYCLGVLRGAREFFHEHGGETDLSNYWYMMLLLIRHALAPESGREKPSEGLRAAAERLRQEARQNNWDAASLSATLISLATYSPELSEEVAGLELLDEAAGTDPSLAADYADTLTFLRTTLLLGVGSNGYEARDWSAAVQGYAAAITPYLDLGLNGSARNCVRRITDVVSKHPDDPRLPRALMPYLAATALRLETQVGEPAVDALQELYKWTMVSMFVTGDINPVVAMTLLQLCKGLRFSTALLRGSGYDPARDERCAELLPYIKEAETALAAGGGAEESASALDDDILLTSYVRAEDTHSGDTPRERLTNIRQSFDARMNYGVLSGGPGGGTPEVTLDDFITPDEVQESLDERTVLLNYYLGAAPDGRTAAFVFLFTREDLSVTFITHQFPDSIVSMSDGERTMLCSPFAPLVQEVRRSVVEYPGPWLVAEEAGKILADDARGFLGHFVEKLDELGAAGKDHLCIVPHGPLHFYPLHLLGEPGHPLAEKWKVSYLPSLRLLKRRGRAPRPRRERDAAAFGLTFGDYNPHGLEPLEDSAGEVSAVAGVFGASPALDEAATKEAVFEGLVTSRYVHIATHGEHNVDAPAFQCIYLAAGGQSDDGRLFAHELLSLDLRGVEMLTLSACETALGRFDYSDNLRGLPASFLLAGVETLVGTLWPVESAPAELFFSTLYAELKAGGKRLDAFVNAQRAARAEFPKYAQWGPFYLMGEWD